MRNTETSLIFTSFGERRFSHQRCVINHTLIILVNLNEIISNLGNFIFTINLFNGVLEGDRHSFPVLCESGTMGHRELTTRIHIITHVTMGEVIKEGSHIIITTVVMEIDTIIGDLIVINGVSLLISTIRECD